MNTFLSKIFNSLYSFFPWYQNPYKRNRENEISDDEDGENLNPAVPAKKPRIQNVRMPLGPKILKEMNQPSVTTVKSSVKPSISKLQISGDFYQVRRKISANPLMFQKWGSSLNESGKAPKHVSSPTKLKRRLSNPLLPVTRIDLTRNDESKSLENYHSIPEIDLTQSDLLPGSSTNSKTSGSTMKDKHKKISLDEQLLLSTSKNKKPILSIDLTQDKEINDRKRGSPEGRKRQTRDFIDLEERNTYGRVLGSMLEGKLTPSRMQSPKLKNGMHFDLTHDDDDDVKEVPSTPMILIPQPLKTNVKEVKASPAEDSTSLKSPTKMGVTTNITKTNTFEDKLKDISYTHEDWVMNLMKDYNETQKSFVETRDRFYHESTAWREENRKTVEEILESKLERFLRLTESFVSETPEEYPSIIVPLPQLTKQIEARIKAALVRSPEGEVLIDKFNLKIARRDIQTLNGLNWLNDEVINFYMQLLEERAKHNEEYPSLHTFSTFFYAGLQTRGHAGMKRWTKKVNIFERDLVIIPIHLHMHWCLVVIDMKKKEVNYYDSMGRDNDECLKHMSNYLIAEHEAKMGKPLDISDWKLENVKNIPQQLNGSDCGVFASMYAEFSSRRAPFTFDQSKMQYFRRKMVYEIITGQLM